MGILFAQNNFWPLFSQGTATPTHYLVLHNSGEMTPDQVSDLSNTKLLIAELVFLLREILLRFKARAAFIILN